MARKRKKRNDNGTRVLFVVHYRDGDLDSAGGCERALSGSLLGPCSCVMLNYFLLLIFPTMVEIADMGHSTTSKV